MWLLTIHTPFPSCAGKSDESGDIFDGDLSDLRIYSGVLSPSEVIQLASLKVNSTCLSTSSKPRAYYPLKENALDSGGSGRHGKTVDDDEMMHTTNDDYWLIPPSSSTYLVTNWPPCPGVPFNGASFTCGYLNLATNRKQYVDLGTDFGEIIGELGSYSFAMWVRYNTYVQSAR